MSSGVVVSGVVRVCINRLRGVLIAVVVVVAVVIVGVAVRALGRLCREEGNGKFR